MKVVVVKKDKGFLGFFLLFVWGVNKKTPAFLNRIRKMGAERFCRPSAFLRFCRSRKSAFPGKMENTMIFLFLRE